MKNWSKTDETRELFLQPIFIQSTKGCPEKVGQPCKSTAHSVKLLTFTLACTFHSVDIPI